MTSGQKTALTIGAAIGAIWWYRTKQSGGTPVATVTTSEGFDLSPYGGPVVYPQSIVQLAQAIAAAEGFNVPGSIPQQANNPGDLKVPGWTGATLGDGITVFTSADEGWNALYKQLYLILTNQSGVYSLDDTIQQMASKWTATQSDAWANNVASILGVSITTPLWSVLA